MFGSCTVGRCLSGFFFIFYLEGMNCRKSIPFCGTVIPMFSPSENFLFLVNRKKMPVIAKTFWKINNKHITLVKFLVYLNFRKSDYRIPTFSFWSEVGYIFVFTCQYWFTFIFIIIFFHLKNRCTTYWSCSEYRECFLESMLTKVRDRCSAFTS